MTRYKIIFSLFLLWKGLVFQSISATSPRVLNAIAVTGGVTFSKQKWSFTNPDYTQKNKFIMGFNGSVRAELFARDYSSVIAELQFNQKGTTEKDAFGNKLKNKVNYIAFNAFYKIFYPLDAITPYILMGPRVEYALSQATASPAITGNFRKIHVTASVGAGLEFASYGNVTLFSEVHFNPDVMRSYKQSNLSIRTTAYEIRVGLKYRFANKRYACPPVYRSM